MPDPHKTRLLSGALIFMGLLSLSSCSLTRGLEEDAYLLRKNRVQIISDEPKQNFTNAELQRYYRQKPNKRMFLVVPFRALAYNAGESIQVPDTAGFSGFRKWGWNRKHNFRLWVMRNGEPPVVFDTIAVKRTADQMESFLFTRGHFHADVESMVSLDRKKARVRYTVYPGPGYHIRNFITGITTEDIQKLYDRQAGQSLIRQGAPYDEKVFQQERDRITRILKDSGYYHFNKAYIVIEVDTFMPGNQLDVYLRVLDQSFYDEEVRDSIIIRKHQRSRISKIFINPEYEGVFVQKDYQVIPIEVDASGGKGMNTYHILASGRLDYQPEVLIRNILLEPGQLYCLRDVELTYLYLSDLGNFGNITITFNDTPDPPQTDDTTVLWLDCVINLTLFQKQSYEVQMDFTNRASDPGVSSRLVYQNRNLFRGAEIMSLALKGALEVQKILDKDQVESTIFDNLPFNTVELGAEADIRVPKLVAPMSISAFPKTFKPRTRFAGGVNFQERPDYKRYIIKVSAGYEWQMGHNITMALTPVELNAVSIQPDASFIEKINALADQRLKNSYTDHLITALSWSMVIDRQSARARSKYSFIRINIESAGLLVNAFRESFNYPLNDQGVAMVFNIPYAQYLRSDFDYRQFFRLRQKDQLLAARVYLGLGNPYGNMNVLPFEKSFYVGGANGIRAWPVRTLGPGSYRDLNNLTRFDRTGDFGLETSVEYRFPVYSSLHGALFLDAGNIWLKNKSEQFPGGEFEARNFIREMALGTGFGFRLVTFFVIRFDAGIKLHDPSRPEGEKWMLDEFRIKRINWNFGIGYSI